MKTYPRTICFLALCTPAVFFQETNLSQGPGHERPRRAFPVGKDVSSDFEITVGANNQYEQMEPIKLELKYKNISVNKYVYDIEISYFMVDFDIARLKTVSPRPLRTSFYEAARNAPLVPGSLNVPFQESRLILRPNLLYDLLLPDVYQVIVVIAIKEAQTSKPCVIRSRPVRFEVIPVKF